MNGPSSVSNHSISLVISPSEATNIEYAEASKSLFDPSMFLPQRTTTVRSKFELTDPIKEGWSFVQYDQQTELPEDITWAGNAADILDEANEVGMATVLKALEGRPTFQVRMKDEFPYLLDLLNGQSVYLGSYEIDSKSESPFWRRSFSSKEIHVYMTLVRADIQEVRAVERDLLGSLKNGGDPGLSELGALDGTYRKGKGNVEGVTREFVTISIYSHVREHEFVLRVLELCGQGWYETRYYASALDDPSKTPEGIGYLAGRDTLIEIPDDTGKIMGLLLISEFGYDLPKGLDITIQADIRRAHRYMKRAELRD